MVGLLGQGLVQQRQGCLRLLGGHRLEVQPLGRVLGDFGGVQAGAFNKTSQHLQLRSRQIVRQPAGHFRRETVKLLSQAGLRRLEEGRQHLLGLGRGNSRRRHARRDIDGPARLSSRYVLRPLRPTRNQGIGAGRRRRR